MEIHMYSWIFLIFFAIIRFQPTQGAECKYGERGSLTVYCINATADYFKLSRYRYDHLDETLKCINCSLTSIESGSFDISGNQIKTLDIRRSNINVIKSKAFIGLIFMEKLLLSYNTITDLQLGAFIGIRKLKYIDLEYAISNLTPKVFQELHVLEVLILRNNDLTGILPGTFDGLHNLKLLDLSNNIIAYINNSFDGLVNLRALKLNDNMLTVIYGNEFKDLKSLLALNLENNVITNFTIDIPVNSLRSLDLKSNRLNENSFKPKVFITLDNLEQLDLSKNSFTKIPARFFLGLFRLTMLNLHENNLKEFTTGSFSGLPHLRTLNVSRNQLQSANVSGRLRLISLDRLDLSNNRISELNYIDLMGRLPRLSHINLVNNDLPCKVLTEIAILFSNDNIDFDKLQTCPTDTRTPDELLKELAAEYKQEYQGNPLVGWYYLLVTLLIILLAVLFYIQFFILTRNSTTTMNFKIMKNFTSFSSSRLR